MAKTFDPFDQAKNTEPPALPTRFVSTSTVEVGEGLQFAVASLDLVDVRNADDPETQQVLEITGVVIESRARKFVDGQDVVVTCRAIRLAQLANHLSLWREDHPGAEAIVTLIRGEDEGKLAGWRWTIRPEEEAEPA